MGCLWQAHFNAYQFELAYVAYLNRSVTVTDISSYSKMKIDWTYKMIDIAAQQTYAEPRENSGFHVAASSSHISLVAVYKD
jgi:hypothetical protein